MNIPCSAPVPGIRRMRWLPTSTSCYDQQLKEKRDILIQSLERHTRLSVDQIDIKETIGMEDPWNYRNKSQFQVGQKDGQSTRRLVWHEFTSARQY